MADSTYSAGWAAPVATAPLEARLVIPGSKSLTNRELVLSALAAGPSTLHAPLVARDTELMVDALRALGTTIDTAPDTWRITPGELHGGVDLHAGLAGTVMRFIPPVAALADGAVTIDGDAHARNRPMRTTIDALRALGVGVEDGGRGSLPFTINGNGMVEGGELTIDASASSQFVSGLLLAAPRFRDGLALRHAGERLPSLPHIEMTIATLARRGVTVTRPEPATWVVEPGPIAGAVVPIEPDLSNAGPFLAAALLAGGRVTITGWPAATTQVGDLFATLLPRFGATVTRGPEGLTVDGGAGFRGGSTWTGIDLDLTEGGELAPTFAALAALATTASRITGIGHLRGHETDRLAALVAEITGLGGRVTELDDGLAFEPALLHGAPWRAYADHRMATTGALLGLVVPGIVVDNIATTAKTLPEFPALWEQIRS
ncbi:3-phosphoshikimate 1-carboxyvinyltransferase [Pseudolysinimonas sp.]|uniref:3-phosphoshikimate 1-carboxyvinyltransferase n=1 Tax=Pseudolysinimonas sp. TaxID=2680009 RepID=UPI00286C2823|nr:3-phosphoshikimate 1-carboxyvinyltransferase [Pseudolysinimonas sp.]